ESELDLPFLIISGGIGEDVAVAAMKAGGNDYLMKGMLARLAPPGGRGMRGGGTRPARRRAGGGPRGGGRRDPVVWGNSAGAAVERELREAETRAARRRAEEALRESEQRYRLLWENSTDAVVLIDGSGVVQFANPAVEEIFGYKSGDLMGQGFEQLLADRA